MSPSNESPSMALPPISHHIFCATLSNFKYHTTHNTTNLQCNAILKVTVTTSNHVLEDMYSFTTCREQSLRQRHIHHALIVALVQLFAWQYDEIAWSAFPKSRSRNANLSFSARVLPHVVNAKVDVECLCKPPVGSPLLFAYACTNKRLSGFRRTLFSRAIAEGLWVIWGTACVMC
jgi:hypothetical protein